MGGGLGQLAGMPQDPPLLPVVDLAVDSTFSPRHVEQFLAAGLIVFRNFLSGVELAGVQADPALTVDRLRSSERLVERRHEASGRLVPARVEGVLGLSSRARAVAAAPLLLSFVEACIGARFVISGDSVVIKAPGAGAAVPWHRDGAGPDEVASDLSLVAGIYLDAALPSNCVHAMPGSHLLSHDEAHRLLAWLSEADFDRGVGRRIITPPGSMVIHHLLVLHGSPETSGPQRRVIYLGFRSAASARRIHSTAYAERAAERLRRCIAEQRRPEFRRRNS